MVLFHYYDSSIGPFRNLSDLSLEDADRILSKIRETRPDVMSAKRQQSYNQDRRRFEGILREEFLKKGGVIRRRVPHYFTVEACPWLETWFENCACIEIPIRNLKIASISFTYGDSHPTFSDQVNDGREYRKRLYTFDEILKVIEKYGYPQDWNPDGKKGPERYIEAHVWSDKGILPFLNQN